MVEELRHEIGKLIVTSRGLEPARHLRFALRRAIPGARVRGTGFRGVLSLEATGGISDLARLVYDECSQRIGHVTGILATVESREEPIKEAAVRIGVTQVGPEESFSFRLHKRGAHGLGQDTSKLEREIGGAIWMALEGTYHKKPKVNLKDPDVTVVSEILGPTAAWHLAQGLARRISSGLDLGYRADLRNFKSKSQHVTECAFAASKLMHINTLLHPRFFRRGEKLSTLFSKEWEGRVCFLNSFMWHVP